jgi:PPE-repeat protein
MMNFVAPEVNSGQIHSDGTLGESQRGTLPPTRGWSAVVHRWRRGPTHSPSAETTKRRCVSVRPDHEGEVRVLRHVSHRHIRSRWRAGVCGRSGYLFHPTPKELAMDFGALPPEFHSKRMYSGQGSRSMISAAAAWNKLAVRLYMAAADYRSVASAVAETWQDPAATAVTQALAPAIGWLSATGAQAEQTAVQAKAAAIAYESALAALVPPPVIDSNHALRISLTATNWLGQNSTLIADFDAEYEQMWAQDVDAMYAYARASADASTVTPFIWTSHFTAESLRDDDAAAATASSCTAPAAQEIIAAGNQVVLTIPEALQALSSSTLTELHASLSSVTSPLAKLSSLSGPLDIAINFLNLMNKSAAVRTLFPNQIGVGCAGVTAGVGRGGSIGMLSVPPLLTPQPNADTRPEHVHPYFGLAVADASGTHEPTQDEQ